MFSGNDLPGVMLSGGARRLASLYGVAPGTRAVIVTTSDRGIRAALALQSVGVEIAVVADLRSQPSRAATRLAANRIESLQGWTVVAARGHKTVTGAVLAPVAGLGDRTAPHDRRELECDLLIVSGGDAPATSLVSQAGATTVYDEINGYFRVGELPPGVSVAGQLAGEGGWGIAAESGELAGLEAARALGLAENGSAARRAEIGARLKAAARDRQAIPPAAASDGSRGRAFACFCEDVSAKDIARGIKEGYDSIELCKRYTTVTMGPCQGRMCQLTSIRLMAEKTGQKLEEVGTTTARPPWSTVPMGALAGRPIEPAKRSSIHGRHRELGARIQWAGDWRRAYDYGDPEGEALAVHQSAGVIDVSTLGKLLVRGPEAGAFLDRLYPNRMSTLKPGRVRYGVLTSDAGRIMDDGTVSRLDEETFYVTTTSSGAGAVEQWFSWWLADWRMDVHLSDVTQALSAVNLAGPKAREILTQADRCRLLAGGVHLPRRPPGEGRRRAVPAAADRVRRRARLRDPLSRRLRRGPVGRAAEGRRAGGHPPVRPRAAADPAPAEAAHHRRPGHRLGIDPVRRGDAVGGQARQGRGLHRQVGARARRRAAVARPRSSGSR